MVGQECPSPVVRVRSAFDVNSRLLSWATKRPHFKTGLFRFVDVFPACTSPHDVLDHLDEYLLTDDAPGVVRTGLGAAHALPLGARAARRAANAGIRRMAQQFIGGTNPTEAVERARDLWNDGYATTVDLLGERTLTRADADGYARRVATRVQVAVPSGGSGRCATLERVERASPRGPD